MRIIAHVDMDAFYTQVEIRRDVERLAGKPVVVIQYNPFGDLSTLRPEDDRLKPESNGSIIAVSYEARKYGVKRNMMAQQAKKLCSELQIVQVPVAHGKADLTIYRDAGAAVIKVLSQYAVCERASIDEAYLDLTSVSQQLLADARLHHSVSSTAAAAASADCGSPKAVEALAAVQWHSSAAGVESNTTASAELREPEATCKSHEATQQHLFAKHHAVPGAILPCPENFDSWHVAGLHVLAKVAPRGFIVCLLPLATAQDADRAVAVRHWWMRSADQWVSSDALLAAGSVIVARARAAVQSSLGFSCSAGIAHSKVLAKLGSGLHKPAQQTIVPATAVADLLAPLPLPKLRQLGGKFGEEVMSKLGVSTVGELAAVPLPRLEATVGVQDAQWLHQLAQGKDGEEVKARKLPQTISCGKTFRAQNVLTGLTAVHNWLLQLAQELQERIEADRQQHQRLPKLLTVSFDSAPVQEMAGAGAAAKPGDDDSSGKDSIAGANGRNGASHGRLNPQNWRAGAVSVSRSCALRHPRADCMAADALGLVKKWARDRRDGFRIVTMFMAASNFSLAPTGASTLDRFFKSAPAQAPPATGALPGEMVSFLSPHLGDAEFKSASCPDTTRLLQLQAETVQASMNGVADFAGTSKRPAAAATFPDRPSKLVRKPGQQPGLQVFFAASAERTVAPVVASCPGAAVGAGQQDAAGGVTQQGGACQLVAGDGAVTGVDLLHDSAVLLTSMAAEPAAQRDCHLVGAPDVCNAATGTHPAVSRHALVSVMHVSESKATRPQLCRPTVPALAALQAMCPSSITAQQDADPVSVSQDNCSKNQTVAVLTAGDRNAQLQQPLCFQPERDPAQSHMQTAMQESALAAASVSHASCWAAACVSDPAGGQHSANTLHAGCMQQQQQERHPRHRREDQQPPQTQHTHNSQGLANITAASVQEQQDLSLPQDMQCIQGSHQHRDQQQSLTALPVALLGHRAGESVPVLPAQQDSFQQTVQHSKQEQEQQQQQQQQQHRQPLFEINDIDQEVLAALPLDIQMEVQQHLMSRAPSGRQHICSADQRGRARGAGGRVGRTKAGSGRPKKQHNKGTANIDSYFKR